MGWVRLAVAWATVAVFAVFGAEWLSDLSSTTRMVVLFAILFGVIVWAAFGVVHEAEEIAHRLGEPYGTLILTLSIVVIEVALVSAVMLGAKGAPTLGRDTMFAVLMIVLNGVVGIGLLVGGWRHHQLAFNLRGAAAYLAVLMPLSVIALIVPNFTVSTRDGVLTPIQATFFSIFTVLLYGLFLLLQTGRHKGFFVHLGEGVSKETETVVPAGSVLPHVGLLLANVLPIVLLAKSLATVLDRGIAALGAPPALGGVLIAAIVFTPEGISALRAVVRGQLQRSINLCLGAATSTIGLTVPAILTVGLLTGQTVVLGLSPVEMTLLALTLILSTLTFSSQRVTVLEGAVHLTVFCVYVVLIFSP